MPFILNIFIIIMRGEHFVGHLDGPGGTPVAHHCSEVKSRSEMKARNKAQVEGKTKKEKNEATKNYKNVVN
jgi:hypothetical protein